MWLFCSSSKWLFLFLSWTAHNFSILQFRKGWNGLWSNTLGSLQNGTKSEELLPWWSVGWQMIDLINRWHLWTVWPGTVSCQVYWQLSTDTADSQPNWLNTVKKKGATKKKNTTKKIDLFSVPFSCSPFAFILYKYYAYVLMSFSALLTDLFCRQRTALFQNIHTNLHKDFSYPSIDGFRFAFMLSLNFGSWELPTLLEIFRGLL